MVAYTIGSTKSYDQALSEEPRVQKLGAYEDYEGGWVWKTTTEAHTFIVNTTLPFNASVYELQLPTSWEVDVSPTCADDGVHRLLHDALIIRKI